MKAVQVDDLGMGTGSFESVSTNSTWSICRTENGLVRFSHNGVLLKEATRNVQIALFEDELKSHFEVVNE